MRCQINSFSVIECDFGLQSEFVPGDRVFLPIVWFEGRECVGPSWCLWAFEEVLNINKLGSKTKSDKNKLVVTAISQGFPNTELKTVSMSPRTDEYSRNSDQVKMNSTCQNRHTENKDRGLFLSFWMMAAAFVFAITMKRQTHWK